MDAKKILIPVIALLIGLILGFAFGQSTGQQQAGQPTEAELERLRGIIEEFWPITPEMFSVNGQVKEIKTSSLLIETFNSHPLEELPTIREVSVTNDTIIVRLAEKDPEIYEREMEEYMRLEQELMVRIEDGIEVEDWPAFPENYLETEITLDQIETGSSIRAEADQDIKWAERFTAVKIAVEF